MGYPNRKFVDVKNHAECILNMLRAYHLFVVCNINKNI